MFLVQKEADLGAHSDFVDNEKQTRPKKMTVFGGKEELLYVAPENVVGVLWRSP